MKILIKKSTLNDRSFFFSLRNQANNRKLSLSSSKINIKEHIDWYSSNYKKNIFYTCYANNTKAGYIRAEYQKDTLLISIAFLKKFQKKNIATKCYNIFEKKLSNNFILIAKIKNNNSLSKKFFIKNNFSLLKKEKKIQTYYKIYFNNKNNYLETIKKIENVRKGNNINWMNILRIAFRHSPLETSAVFKDISIDDNKINKLSKKLF
jgi:hypothetical protein